MLTPDTKERLRYALARGAAADEVESLLGAGRAGTSYYVDGTNGRNTNDGLSWEGALATITKAITKVATGDVIYIAPGDYNEAVSIDGRAYDDLTLVGMGNRGGVAIATTTTNATGLTLSNVRDLTIINIGCAGDGSGSGLILKNRTDRFRAYGCKFEGGAVAARIGGNDASGTRGCADGAFFDCEFAWSGMGVKFVLTGSSDLCTQFLFKDCNFHDLTTHSINDNAGGVHGLWLKDCLFNNDEVGTDPTTGYLALAVSDGIISGCHFACTAANLNSLVEVAALCFWTANATEGGWTSAHPS